jgi:hypothetical protein
MTAAAAPTPIDRTPEPPPPMSQAGAPTKTAAIPPADSFERIHAGLEGATSEDCLGCHADAQPRIQAHRSHPVGLDLAAVAAGAPGRYLPLAEVRGAGLALPDGKVACVTCHDLGSPYKHRIALPAGAVARPGVVLGDPSTYGEDDGIERAAAAAAGQVVSSKPLCQSCHRF